MNKVKGTLVGQDGNAFMLVQHFRKLAKQQNWTNEEIYIVVKEAMSGDYAHVLNTLTNNMTMEEE